MPAAARVLDPTGHPGLITGAGAPNVLINGLPAAAWATQHVCALPPLAGPHPPDADRQAAARPC